jgi:protein involved in polysaccharide export with SLBB domain
MFHGTAGDRMGKKVVLMLMFACALQAQEPTSNISSGAAPSWKDHYTVGPGDTFRIEIYGKIETIRPAVTIQPDGTITYLQAQNIHVDGQTIEEMRLAVQKSLDQYFKNIEVIVQPVKLLSKNYFVLGRVTTKGAFVLDRPITIVEAVARAKGFESGPAEPSVAGLADLSRSFLVRNGKHMPVNFEKLFLEGDFSQNLEIEPNDYLYFPSSVAREIYVVGAVVRPGRFDYMPGGSCIAAITAGGGYTDNAFRERVLIIRGSLNDPETIVVDTNDILKGRAKDVILQPKDIVFVSTRPWKIAEDLLDSAVTVFIDSVITTWTGRNIIINRRDVLPEFNP